MKKMLLLARGDGRQFNDLSGQSILRDVPFDVLVFVDKKNAPYFAQLPPNITVEHVRWSDMPAVAHRAEAAHQAHGLSGVTTLDEKLIEFAAQLRERFDLPGLKPAEAERFRNKVEMKRLLAPSGLALPRFVECTDRQAVYDLLAEAGKIVLKPASGLGSRGVVMVETAAELDAWFAAESAAQEYEAEAFIEGTLYHVNAVVHEGKVLLTASAPYLPGMANIDFAAGTPFVTVMLAQGALRAQLEDFSNRVIHTLGLRNGVTHLECFVTPKGEIVFCEIAVRPGGGGIVLMIEAQTGVHYGRAALLLEAGRGDLALLTKAERQELAGLIGFRAGQGGIVRQAIGREAFGEPWIHSAYVDIQPGEFVAPSAHCTDYVGLVIFSSQNEQDFDHKRCLLQQRFDGALAFDPL